VKFCPIHWSALRDMVIGKGMGALISKDGAAAADRLVEELEGVATPATYDPLMASYWMIMGMAIKNGGLYLMGTKQGDGDGEYCPLCEVEEAGLRVESKSGLADEWLEGCTDAVLVYCREQNLLSKPQ